MIRLLTLQAMILPETLPDFLSWMQQSKNKGHYDISSTFQKQIYQYIINDKKNILLDRIINGVILIIHRLIKQPQLLDPTVWLLADDNGAWTFLYKNAVLPAIDRDFNSINKSNSQQLGQRSLKILNHPNWQGIYKDLQLYWQPNTYKSQLTGYQPIADLFHRLSKVNKTNEELQLHALFLYISQGKISKILFKKLQHILNPKTRHGVDIYIYGIPIRRKVPWSEKLYLNILNFIQIFLRAKIPFPLVLFLMLINSFVFFKLGSTLENSSRISKQNNNQLNTLLKSDNSRTIANITPEQFTIAFDNFDVTKQVITTIKNQLLVEFKNAINNSGELNNPMELKNEIIKATKITLDPGDKSKLKYGSVFEPSPKDVQDNNEVGQWIKAIYSYQQKKKQQLPNITPTGYLIPQIDQSNMPLIDDIRKNIDLELKNMTP